jgi:hypothetical protein
MYHKPLEVLKAAYQESSVAQFHISPFEEYWKPSPETLPNIFIPNSTTLMRIFKNMRRFDPNPDLIAS